MRQSYRDFISAMKARWIGRTVLYDNHPYKVVDVDYNGALLIDKKAKFTDTTAIDAFMAVPVK